MHSGELRQRVTIQARTEVSDGHDGFTVTWAVALSRVPAKLTPLRARDLERARQVDPRISHEVTVRYWQNYPADLDGGRARLIYHDVADRVFEIIGPPIDIDERHEFLTLTCREAA